MGRFDCTCIYIYILFLVSLMHKIYQQFEQYHHIMCWRSDLLTFRKKERGMFWTNKKFVTKFHWLKVLYGPERWKRAGRVGILINWFNPTTFLPLSQARTWISSITCGGLFYDQWAEVKGDCSFCWYWRNYWPSLFKHTFHKQLSSKCKKKP